jgi:hypothetical protein
MKKFLTGSVLGIIILGLSTNWIYDLLKTVPIIGFISKILNIVRVSVINFFMFSIPIWSIILIIAVMVIVIALINSFNKEKPAPYLNYREDVFKNWVWKWDYTIDGVITNVTPYCPKCDVMLVTNNIGRRNTSSYTEARCPNCEKEWRAYDDYYIAQNQNQSVEFLEEIQNLIISKVRKLLKGSNL